jgi:hypothetical protein
MNPFFWAWALIWVFVPVLVGAPIAWALNRSEADERRRAYWEVA